MTPEEAQDMLNRDLDWKAELTAGRRALETIAAMTVEHGVEFYPSGTTKSRQRLWGYPEQTAKDMASAAHNGTHITRYVLDPEMGE